MSSIDNVKRALRHRNYRLYTAGNSVSLIGTWLQRVAVGWLAWRLTHSGTWLGLIAVADLVPTLLASPIAGAWADRADRVKVLRVTQIIAMAQAAILALLTSTGRIDIETLFILTLVLGIANAVNQPARLALVPNLVERRDIGAAVAINALVFHGARFVGPAIAGAVIAWSGASLAFLLNALSYLGFIVALGWIRVAAEAPVARRHLLRESLEGYAYVLRHPGIRPIFLLFAATSLALRGFIELFPGFADQVFGRGAQGLAWLVATVGLGAVCGGLWMVGRSSIRGLTSLIINNSLLLCLAGLGFAATGIYWLALPCVFLCGFAMVVTGIAAQTLIQNAVAPAMRGRVLGLYGMIFRAGPALNALILGMLSSEIGLRPPVAAGAAICLFAWGGARLNQAAIARALESDAQEMPAASDIPSA